MLAHRVLPINTLTFTFHVIYLYRRSADITQGENEQSGVQRK